MYMHTQIKMKKIIVTVTKNEEIIVTVSRLSQKIKNIIVTVARRTFVS